MSIAHLKEATAKLAAGGLETNEDETTKGKANVYPPPPGREPGTLSARWGDAAGHTVVNSTAAVEAAREGREGMVERLFNSPSTSGPAEQELIRTLFNRDTVEDAVKPHSAMLRHGRTKTASDETLTDRVLRVVGHR